MFMAVTRRKHTPFDAPTATSTAYPTLTFT